MGIKVDFRKRYFKKKSDKKKGKDPVFVLDAQFEAGNELVVLFGRSGCGKTTTLQCISGLLKPNGGKIIVNDTTYFNCHTDINLSVQERGLGYVFQNYALFPHMDVKRNIAYGLNGWPEEDMDKRVEEMLDLLHIKGLEENYPSQLSGGQKQRVALARALAPKPDILLLDEPFSALDMVVRMKLRDKIKEIQRELGIPVIFITHNHVEAFTIADRIIIFHNGRVQQNGTPEEVFYHPENKHVAELVGVNNIFENANILQENDAGETLILQSGKLRVVVNKSCLKETDRTSWGIRPENIRIFPADSNEVSVKDENTFEANVKSIVNKGSSKIIAFELQDHRNLLTAEIGNQFFENTDFDIGNSFLVKMPREKIVLF